MARWMSVDVETYSSADLPSCGVYKYVEARDFEILLIGYSLDGGPVRVHDCTTGEPWPEDFLRALTDPNVEKRAYNAAFERQAFARILGEPMPPEQWDCTMVRALTLGLPGSLAAAGAALGLPEDKLKDARGKALINYFSKPCRPTKTNGGRTRNLPAHDPDKWALYIEYNRQDVVTEMAIREKLDAYPLPASERRLWCLDQRMNDRGVRIDVPMVERIVAHDVLRRDALQDEARRITGLANPNSLQQLKGWLQRRGVDMASVTKDTTEAALAGVLPDDVRRVLEIRRALGKTSVAKYSTMLDAVCKDGRLRGILQFYGANRTGRWAGRLVQTHNLARNTLPDLALARELTAEGRFDELETLFGEPAFVFSELVRTAFIPSDGRRFVVSDFSAIEARVISWIAGEEWRLDAFRSGKDIYCETASAMYHVPVVKHGVNGDLRQRGKVAELACIAEGQLVLTDQGLVPIEDVTTDMRLWDGEEWVHHDGVVYKGDRRTINYGGLEATEDHIVWAEVEGKYRKIRFGDAAARGSCLVQSGAGREAVRLATDRFARKTILKRLARLPGADGVHRLRPQKLDDSREYDAGQNEGMPELLAAEGSPALDGSPVHGCEAAMREPEGRRLQELRGQGDPLRLPERDGRLPVYDRDLRDPRQGDGDRQDRHQRGLCPGEPQVRGPQNKLREQAEHDPQQVRPGKLALRENYGDPETVAGYVEGRDHQGCGESGAGEAEKLARNPGTARVYDIRNAGRRHRFTVSDVLVHNCGYQGGVGAMRRMDRSGTIPEEELQSVVDQWRAANPRIVKLWQTFEAAARSAINGKRYAVYKIRDGATLMFSRAGGALFVRLPSGRSICYQGARIREDASGKRSIVYMGVNQETKQWGENETYGGKIVENVVQAVARDCLAEAMTRVEAMGYEIVMHVHDEIIVDVPREDTDALERINAAMGAPIDWAPGLPLKGDGFECEFYQKD